MPTYAFRCTRCGDVEEAVLPIGEYMRRPPAFFCCREPMQRHFDVAPALALHNALASERHYDGMRAQDGTDISSRSKHREYMKSRGLTTVDDFRDTWKKQAAQRADSMAGADPSRVRDVADAVHKLGG